MSKEPKPIRMDEIFAEMERLRKVPKNMELTDAQKAFLTRARTGQKVVSFADLAPLWEKAGWGRTTQYFLRDRWAQMKKEET
jgi:hypothetical protein